MNFGILIFILLILFIITCLLIKYFYNKIQEDKKRITYTRRNTCNYILVDTYLNVLNKHNIEQSKIKHRYDKNSKVLFIPCSYDNIQLEIESLPVTRNNYYMLINKCDIFVGKNNLWLFLNLFYGDNAKLLVPNSYLPYDEKSMEQFKKDYKSDKLYILKKNVQRQEGIKITNDVDEIENCFKKDNFIIIQELLQNPYLINKRKTIKKRPNKKTNTKKRYRRPRRTKKY